MDDMSDDTTYYVRRFCFNEEDPQHRTTIKSGLTLEEAQEHCNREDARGENDYGPWFDGYDCE